MTATTETPAPARTRERVAPPPAPWHERLRRIRPPGGPRAQIAALIVALVGLSAFLRTQALGAGLWIDEGLSVGIASHGFLDIPGVLRQDGSPPLYYMLLHVWMAIFGRSEEAVHALSLLFSLLAIPTTLWAGWTLFGRRAGLIGAAVAAILPFLTVYAQEARMYTLMALLGLLATAGFLHVYVFRRRGYLPLFALALAGMLYTHVWALFFAAVAAGVLATLARDAPDRPALVRDGLIGFGAAGALFLPWVPSLVFQVLHTGAPWSTAPSLGNLVPSITGVLGGDSAAVVLLLAAGAGLAAALRLEGSRERTAVLATAALAGGTLLLAFLLSQVSPAWAPRYLAVIVGPVVLLVAAGLARAGRLGLVALAVIPLFWAQGFTDGIEGKSNAREIAEKLGPLMRPGDLVVSTHPEQVPVLHYYLPGELDYATTLGPTADPRVMDWRDAMDRLRNSDTESALDPLIARLPPGGHVLLVRPIIGNDGPGWKAPWTKLVRKRSIRWGQALARDTRFLRIGRVSTRKLTRFGVRGMLYLKTRR
jgi:mannosyltransferase